MGDVTSKELKAERERVLGAEMGSVFHALWTEVVQLRWEWKEFLTLYDSAGVAELNEHAPAFFWLVQHALSGHVISTIANLTDSEETGRGGGAQPNLTVRRLPRLATPFDSVLGTELENLVRQGVDGPWKRIREWRHKQLAHLDLDVALERRVAPLAPVERTDIDAALAALTDVIRAVDKRLHPDTDTRYDVAGRWGGAETVLFALERARKAEERRVARMKEGRALPEDFER